VVLGNGEEIAPPPILSFPARHPLRKLLPHKGEKRGLTSIGRECEKTEAKPNGREYPLRNKPQTPIGREGGKKEISLKRGGGYNKGYPKSLYPVPS